MSTSRAVCFAFNNLLTSLLIGVLEDVARFVPSVGSLIEMAISILTFYFHRIVLVTDQNVYVYRDWPLAARYPGTPMLCSVVWLLTTGSPKAKDPGYATKSHYERPELLSWSIPRLELLR
jgi:hypothetical protein